MYVIAKHKTLKEKFHSLVMINICRWSGWEEDIALRYFLAAAEYACAGYGGS